MSNKKLNKVSKPSKVPRPWKPPQQDTPVVQVSVKGELLGVEEMEEEQTRDWRHPWEPAWKPGLKVKWE